jgi:RNA polymerase sigma factor (sigma-70 family)
MADAMPIAKEGALSREDQFAAIVDQYEEALLRYASRIVNNADMAQDVVQCVFIKLYQGWNDDFTPTPQLSAWLYRVAHNSAVDMVRRSARRQRLHEEQAHEAAESSEPADMAAGHAADIADLVRRAMEVLDLRERQLVVLKVYEEKSYREMSEITGLGEGNVGYILHHAMKKLAGRIRQLRGEKDP